MSDYLTEYQACGCRPGSPDAGWHEVRSPECVQAELDVWSECMARFKKSEFFLNLRRRSDDDA